MVGTPPFVFPPFGNINPTWVLFGDGHFGPAGGGASDELFYAVDTSAADQLFTLPDPATLPTPFETVINILNWNSGGYELHIAPGVGGTIDGITDGIRTRTPNQGYRFRWGAAMVPPVSGWACPETKFGGDIGGTSIGGPPEGTVGVVACADAIPDWIVDPSLARDYQVLTATSGTYTKPVLPGARFVGVVGWGSGAGGGSGFKAASSDFSGGGTGGGAGARKVEIFDYDTFPATVTYDIHPGGLGGVRSIVAGVASDGEDGGASTLTDSTPAVIFFVGGGTKGVHTDTNPVGLGGQGGSWDQNGTTLGNNANGTEGDGGGGISIMISVGGDHAGCAECGGGAGAGPGSSGTGLPDGGSSEHGGAGGGLGGTVGVFPLVNNPATAGGSTASLNGGGGIPGTTDSSPADPGGSGAAGTGLNGGAGGGGGASAAHDAAGDGGNGGDGGIPGGGGAGGGATNHSSPNFPGSGGNGARGEIRMYVI